MPWYVWLFLGLAGIVVLLGLSLFLLRLNARGRRFLALRSRQKLRFARLLLSDGEVPIAAKALLFLLAAYLAMPIDLIPDFIPVLGQVDDVLMVVGVVGLLLVIVPAERLDAALVSAAAS